MCSPKGAWIQYPQNTPSWKKDSTASRENIQKRFPMRGVLEDPQLIKIINIKSAFHTMSDKSSQYTISTQWLENEFTPGLQNYRSP